MDPAQAGGTESLNEVATSLINPAQAVAQSPLSSQTLTQGRPVTAETFKKLVEVSYICSYSYTYINEPTYALTAKQTQICFHRFY